MSASHIQNGDELREKFAKIITWKSGQKRAPHKPLQLLLALANLKACGTRLQLFSQTEAKMRLALQLFGPVRKSIHPEYPFWHLQNDAIWQVESEGDVILRKKSLNPTAKELRQKGARGGFLACLHEALRVAPEVQTDIIHDILDTHFPSSIHEDILSFFGLDFIQDRQSPPQTNPRFKQRVLTAYDSTCAISNFSVRMDNSVLGVEAAHVIWPQAGGGDEVANAIAMTTLHRKLFHLGAFTIDASYRVRISHRARGSSGFEEILGKFEGKKISLPAAQNQRPSQSTLAWHREQVFRH